MPTLYIPSKVGGSSMSWNTLDNKKVEAVKFDSMKEATDFYKRYENVSNLTIYGNLNYPTQYIQEQYPNNIEFDRKLIRINNLDIEVESEEGFPEPEKAEYPVISICLRQNDGLYRVWGLNDYTRTHVMMFYSSSATLSMICSLSFWITGDTGTPTLLQVGMSVSLISPI